MAAPSIGMPARAGLRAALGPPHSALLAGLAGPAAEARYDSCGHRRADERGSDPSHARQHASSLKPVSAPMDDDIYVEAQDLAIDEIRELLLEAGADISEEQAQHLAQFVSETGGIHE